MDAKIKRDRKINGIVFSIILLLILFLVLGAIFFIRATRPQRQAKAEATAIAQTYGDVATVDSFYWFTWGATYFSVTGTDTNDTPVAVIISQDGEEVKVVNQSEGYTESDIRSFVSQTYNNPTILKANLGMVNDQVVWEIITRNSSNQLTYYLLDFATGSEVSVVADV